MSLKYDAHHNLIENRKPYHDDNGTWIDAWTPQRFINEHEKDRVIISCRGVNKELERVIMSKSFVEKLFAGLDALNIEKRMEKLNSEKKQTYFGKFTSDLFYLLCQNFETQNPLYRRRYIVGDDLAKICFIIKEDGEEEYPK